MKNLYWKSGKEILSLIEKPFRSEAELEKYIFNNQDILGDISLIYRQIRTGQKQGIPDMLGVDQDARICLLELKNQPANEDILPQALRYAIWAETNPDSIKAIWLESKNKPEDIEIDWDNLDIRVILIAPSFKSNVPRMARKLGYQIDLMKITRYSLDNDEFLLVEIVDEEQKPRVTTTKGITTWSWDFYKSEHGEDATKQFRQAVEKIDALVQKKGWSLPYNLNKYYTGFKLGNKVVFSVAWGGTYAWKIKLKLSEEQMKDFESNNWEYQKYDNIFKEVVLRPVYPDNPDIMEIERYFEKAYKKISGSK